MIRIAIVDDEEIFVEYVKNVLIEYQNENQLDFSIASFSNAEDLYSYLSENSCDLIYLDIELDEMNGVELGKIIRDEFNDYITKIAYISSRDCYDRQLLDVQPLGFIPKPLPKSEIIRMVNKVQVAKAQLEDSQTFTYMKKHNLFRVKIQDILYFEVQDHYIKIVTITGIDIFYDTINNVVNCINSDRFIRVHRSYYVNFDQIKKITYDWFLMNNNETIYISRLKRHEVRETVKKLVKGK